LLDVAKRPIPQG